MLPARASGALGRSFAAVLPGSSRESVRTVGTVGTKRSAQKHAGGGPEAPRLPAGRSAQKKSPGAMPPGKQPRVQGHVVGVLVALAPFTVAVNTTRAPEGT